jgi:toxin YoeB
MGRQIIWSPEASDLLVGILTYWEERNGSQTYSLKLNRLFQECLKQVAKYPESGRKSKYQYVHYRIVRDYYIYYYYDDKSIEVLSLTDMRRDPDYILAQDEAHLSTKQELASELKKWMKEQGDILTGEPGYMPLIWRKKFLLDQPRKNLSVPDRLQNKLRKEDYLILDY